MDAMMVNTVSLVGGVASAASMVNALGKVLAKRLAKHADDVVKGLGIRTTDAVTVSGTRAIDKATTYESGVRGLYSNSTFSERQFQAIVDGKLVNGVADDVTVINGKIVAVESKYVDNWEASLRNPYSPNGQRSWAVTEQNKMISREGI